MLLKKYFLFKGRLKQTCTMGKLLYVWCSIFIFFISSFAYADDDYFRFGVLPLQSPTKLAGMFMPLSKYLSKVIGRPVQFVTSPNFTSFMDRVKRREYDLIYLNPLLYRRSHKYGYSVIAKVASEPFTGILVVRRDSPIKRLTADSLPAGLRIGFPDPDAFAATVLTRQYLKKVGIDVDSQMHVQYFGSQDSALLALHSGLVDITGTWRPSLRSMPGQVRKDLRIIAETLPQPQMPIAVRDDLPPEEIKRIRDALISLTSDEQSNIIKHLGFKIGFEAATNKEYLNVSE
ncbi:MAG: phosphate/phosphite/phosphonate ABC transporter substrate-binding protein [Woeseiaceae bacterium]